MAISRALRLTYALAAGLACAPAARAQHVVTADEAAKLTLEALTAEPARPVYRPIYRAYYRPAMATRFSHERFHGWQRGFIRASYRTPLSHHAVRHHRR